jgi:hypothetical protein
MPKATTTAFFQNRDSKAEIAVDVKLVSCYWPVNP